MRIVLVLTFLLAPSFAFAFCDDWTTSNTVLEAGFQALVLVDWQQTLHAYDQPGFSETNPLLGRHPSREHINTLIPLGMVAHAVISCWLDSPPREWWQGISVFIEAAVVAHNSTLGVRFGF